MRKMFLLSLILVCSAAVSAQKKAKYVFYFISDGTGVNIVQAAEHYRADVKGLSKNVNGDDIRMCNDPFCFSQFPVVGMATTYSASSRVTDSAASGTALATGHKTVNGYIGLAQDGATPVYSVCKAAKTIGMAVGVGTSVSIDHATPAAFYAHNKDRNDYHSIGHDLLTADYVDFFGGSDLRKPTSDKHPDENLYDLAENAGITVAYGVEEFKQKMMEAKRIMLVQSKEEMTNSHQLCYAMDKKPGNMTIEEVLEAEIAFLEKTNKGKGFFLMNEIGGLVDWADHSNDAGAAFAELEAVNRCVQIALEFYKKHPKETLIVMTADHDTGGPSIGIGKYEMTPKALQTQKIAKDNYTPVLTKMRKDSGNKVTWEMVQESLKEMWGFWTVHKLTWEQEKMLRDTYERTLGPKGRNVPEFGEYKQNEQLAAAACKVLGEIAQISYAHGAHTGGYVPVYAIGVGADEFKGMNDNAEIPLKLAKIIGAKF